MKKSFLLLPVLFMFASINSHGFGVTPSAKKKGQRVSCNGFKGVVLKDATNRGSNKHLLDIMWISSSKIDYGFYGPHCDEVLVEPIRKGMDNTHVGDRVSCDNQSQLGTVSDILTNKAVFVRFDDAPNQEKLAFLDECDNQSRAERIKRFKIGDIVTCGRGNYGEVLRYTADNIMELKNLDESQPWSLSFEIYEDYCELKTEE